VGRGDEIYIVTAVVPLKDHHDISQGIKRHLAAFTEVAYGPVLAEQAPEVAAGKKNSA